VKAKTNQFQEGRTPDMNYIGVDFHSATLNLAVANETGRITSEKIVPTSEKNL